jgi:steroid delta-isomerase-like uncharacterized protein
MSTKENKELDRQFFNDANTYRGDIAKAPFMAEKYFAPDWVFHHPSRGDMNREQFIQFMVGISAAFPDFKFSIDDVVAEGDKVVTRYTLRGTHMGPYSGIPATGKQVAIKGVSIDKIVGGKFAETWDFPDSLGTMTQLGITPGAAPKK